MPKIPPRPGIEVFWNKNNTITIKQVIGGPYDEESLVVVHPEDVPKLVEMLEDVADGLDDDVKTGEDVGPQDTPPTIGNTPGA